LLLLFEPFPSTGKEPSFFFLVLVIGDAGIANADDDILPDGDFVIPDGDANTDADMVPDGDFVIPDLR
jgi:hypothetical protein